MTESTGQDTPAPAPVDGGRLLVVGAGLMGQQIALQSALSSVDVVLIDVAGPALDAARTSIEGLLGSRVAKGRITAEESDAALARLELTTDLAAIAGSCSWAIEAVVERLDVKQQVFGQLAAALPDNAGLTTNSSHIRAATIAADADWAPRALNMHFFHPVLVMDLVEVVAAPLTDTRYVEAAVAWANRIRRTPVTLNKDLDGFLVNRVLGEASREAFRLLAGGVASVQDIDIAITRGLRWPMGPFQLADLSGLDLMLQSRGDRYARHGDEADLFATEILRPMVEAGRRGRKSGAGFYDYSVDPPAPLPVELPGSATSSE